MTAAVVPFKGAKTAKSRLEGALGARSRRQMALMLLHHVLDVLAAVPAIDRLAVVSPTPMTDLAGVTALVDAGEGLNAAVRTAVAWANSLDVDCLLIVPADLPILQTDDILAIMNAMPAGTSGLVAPSHDGGTSALGLRPPSAIGPEFGPQSARRHLAAFARAGIPAAVVERPGLALDIDSADDLDRVDWDRLGYPRLQSLS